MKKFFDLLISWKGQLIFGSLLMALPTIGTCYIFQFPTEIRAKLGCILFLFGEIPIVVISFGSRAYENKWKEDCKECTCGHSQMFHSDGCGVILRQEESWLGESYHRIDKEFCPCKSFTPLPKL